MSYRVERHDGKVAGVTSEAGFHRKGDDNPHWQDFLDWREKLPPEEKAKYDLGDKPPEPEPVDQDLERIEEILARFDTASPAERWEAVLKFMRKRI